MSSTTENVDDRLSMLPDGVLSRILSLLPTRLAVQTSILSKRWRYSWLFVKNLELDDNFIHLHNTVSFMRFIDRVLKSPRTSHVKLFRFNFSRTPFPRSLVSNWIDETVRLNVTELDIHVCMLELPLSVFTCKTLTHLRLKLGERDLSDWECPSSVCLPCLKTLDIAIYGNLSGNAIRLIQGCPMLENLSLEETLCEEDLIFNIPTLKLLILALLSQTGCRLNNVVLTVPNLESLFVGGELSSYFVMKDVSSLVEASFAMEDVFYLDLCEELVKGVTEVKSLSIQKMPSDFLLPIFPNMKHLELTTKWHSGQIMQFLENSPVLEHLCIEELQGPRYWDEEPEEYAWIEPKTVPQCMLTNLATFKFSKTKGRTHEQLFLKYLLGKAEALKTVTIGCEGISSDIEAEKRVSAELFELPRAFECCEIHYHGNRFHSVSTIDGSLGDS